MTEKQTIHAILRGSLLLPFLLWSLTALGFHLGIPITDYHLWIGLGIFAAVQAFLFQPPRRVALLSTIIPIAWLAGCTAIAALVLDTSGDGRQYHLEAILQLQWGWNPFREAITPDVWDISWAVWLNSLSKMIWIVSAVVAKGVQWSECAKFFAPYCLLLTSLSAYSFLRFGFSTPRRYAIVGGLLSIFNGVVATQFLSNYTDGVTAALGTVAIYSFVEFIKHDSTEMRCRLALAFILACSAKFTTLYPLLTLGVLWLIMLYRREPWKKATITWLKFAGVGAIFAFVFNFNPYLTNLFRYGNLNYPMSGTQLIKLPGFGTHRLLSENDGVEGPIYSAHLPLNFQDKNRVERFFYSLFSTCEHVSTVNKTGANLKWPWVAHTREWDYLGESDGRISGLGPRFAAIFLVSTLFLLLALKREPLLPLTGLAILVATAANPYSWWMRYVGFFYAYTLLGFAALATHPFRRDWARITLSAVFAWLVVSNCYPIYRRRLEIARGLSAEMVSGFQKGFRANGYVEFEAYHGGTRGYLSDRQIPFLSPKVEVKLVQSHYLVQSDPCVKQWDSWYDRDPAPVPPEEHKRRAAFFNLQGHYLLRESLSPAQKIEAALCYSTVSTRKAQVTRLLGP